MEFSTQTSASLHQLKTPALAVGVFIDKQLSDAADIIDRAGNGAIRQAIGAEFSGKPGSTLVLRAVPGVSAERIVLVGLGKQADYSAKTHATAEQA
ncbi:MAG: M17 family peptidase N-terminal domain-containing protein, partial [Burkholderiaceae bacterium]